MTVPRRHLSRYVVLGTRKDGSAIMDTFNSGREAYVMESYYRRTGATGVRIVIKSPH